MNSKWTKDVFVIDENNQTSVKKMAKTSNAEKEEAKKNNFLKAIRTKSQDYSKKKYQARAYNTRNI